MPGWRPFADALQHDEEAAASERILDLRIVEHGQRKRGLADARAAVQKDGPGIVIKGGG